MTATTKRYLVVRFLSLLVVAVWVWYIGGEHALYGLGCLAAGVLQEREALLYHEDLVTAARKKTREDRFD